jgi:hypothetical protein
MITVLEVAYNNSLDLNSVNLPVPSEFAEQSISEESTRADIFSLEDVEERIYITLDELAKDIFILQNVLENQDNHLFSIPLFCDIVQKLQAECPAKDSKYEQCLMACTYRIFKLLEGLSEEVKREIKFHKIEQKLNEYVGLNTLHDSLAVLNKYLSRHHSLFYSIPLEVKRDKWMNEKFNIEKDSLLKSYQQYFNDDDKVKFFVKTICNNNSYKIQGFSAPNDEYTKGLKMEIERQQDIYKAKRLNTARCSNEKRGQNRQMGRLTVNNLGENRQKRRLRKRNKWLPEPPKPEPSFTQRLEAWWNSLDFGCFGR